MVQLFFITCMSNYWPFYVELIIYTKSRTIKKSIKGLSAYNSKSTKINNVTYKYCNVVRKKHSLLVLFMEVPEIFSSLNPLFLFNGFTSNSYSPTFLIVSLINLQLLSYNKPSNLSLLIPLPYKKDSRHYTLLLLATTALSSVIIPLRSGAPHFNLLYTLYIVRPTQHCLIHY